MRRNLLEATKPADRIAVPEAPTAREEAELFLSPRWVHAVAERIETAKRADQYFMNLLADFSLRVLYVIEGIPRGLRRFYGGRPQAQIFVNLHRGKARRIEVGPAASEEAIDVRVTVQYEIARQLFLGELSPAVTIINGKVKAEPAAEFRRWPLIAARGLVTANRILKTARNVPTAFETQSNGAARRDR